MTSYQEEAILVMHFELGKGVGEIADEFCTPCELFGRHYDPIFIHPREIAQVIDLEKIRRKQILESILRRNR